MKYIILLLMLISVSAFAQTNYRTVMTDTNGVLQRPTNFISTNRIVSVGTNGIVNNPTNFISANFDSKFSKMVTNSVTSFSTNYVNYSDTLIVPAGTYYFSGVVFVSTESTNGGIQAEIVPSNLSSDTTSAILFLSRGSSLNGVGVTPISISRVGNNLFQFVGIAFDDAPTLASWTKFSGIVTFTSQQTNTFRVRQRTATDTNNGAVLQSGSYIEFIEIKQ